MEYPGREPARPAIAPEGRVNGVPGGRQRLVGGSPGLVIEADSDRRQDPCFGANLDLVVVARGLPIFAVGFDDWQLALNVQNLRTQNPVNYDVNKGGYDIAYDDPRGRYYVFSATWRF